MEKLLDKKLESNKESLLLELKCTLVNEIKITITNEIHQNISRLFMEQKSLQKEIGTIKTFIANLEAENIKLLAQIKQLENKLALTLPHENVKMCDCKEMIEEANNSKKMVLYGLNEYGRENQHELHDRVIHIFQEILNTNLLGYIEDLTRIGRRGYRRPLVIELLSKQKPKYLLQYKKYFKDTGLAITEYLNEKPLLLRNTLRKKCIEARRNGHHALIKNNILFINGHESVIPQPQPQQTYEKPCRISHSSMNDDNNNSSAQPKTVDNPTTLQYSENETTTMNKDDKFFR